MSARLWIGVLFFYVLAIVICNVTDGSQMVSSALSEDVVGMVDYNETTSTETATGGSISFFDKSWTFIKKLVFFDYSLFYDVETGYTESTCESAGGTWQSGSSTCRIPNNFQILRYLLIAMGAVIIIELVITLRRITLG